MTQCQRLGLLGAAVLLGGSLLLLGGCATLNEDECRTVDWRTIGYEDGTRGYSGERISQHRKACARYGITPDLGLYQSGRESGLREYCRPANGFQVGAAGQDYTDICPADLEADFSLAYEAGRQLYELRARAAAAAARLDTTREELEHAEDELVGSSAAIISSDSSPERRAQALVDTKQLAEQIGRLKAEIQHLEDERVRCERELADYRATLDYPQ